VIQVGSVKLTGVKVLYSLGDSGWICQADRSKSPLLTAVWMRSARMTPAESWPVHPGARRPIDVPMDQASDLVYARSSEAAQAGDRVDAGLIAADAWIEETF